MWRIPLAAAIYYNLVVGEAIKATNGISVHMQLFSNSFPEPKLRMTGHEVKIVNQLPVDYSSIHLRDSRDAKFDDD